MNRPIYPHERSDTDYLLQYQLEDSEANEAMFKFGFPFKAIKSK